MKQQIELIACDVDGTLLFDYAPELPASTLQAVERVIDQGIVFVPTSGRTYDSLCKLFGPLVGHMPFIANNGTVAYDGERVVFRSEMQRWLGDALIDEILATDDLEALVTGARTSYVQPKDPRFPAFMSDTVGFDVTVVEDLRSVGEPFTKISAYYPSGTVDEAYWIGRYGDECSIAAAGFGWLDIMPKGTNKAMALSALLDHLEISPDNIVAIGDARNDLEMLKLAGLSIAMETGDPRVIEIADKTTASAELELRKLLP